MGRYGIDNGVKLGGRISYQNVVSADPDIRPITDLEIEEMKAEYDHMAQAALASKKASQEPAIDVTKPITALHGDTTMGDDFEVELMHLIRYLELGYHNLMFKLGLLDMLSVKSSRVDYGILDIIRKSNIRTIDIPTNLVPARLYRSTVEYHCETLAKGMNLLLETILTLADDDGKLVSNSNYKFFKIDRTVKDMHTIIGILEAPDQQLALTPREEGILSKYLEVVGKCVEAVNKFTRINYGIRIIQEGIENAQENH